MAPPNFSWITQDLLAAMAFPGEKDHLLYLLENGVTNLVSLTAESSPPVEQVPELGWHKLLIQDLTPPTMAQVISFINIVKNARKNKTAVGIHCAAGRGRTGTMVACFMVYDMKITAKDAIELIRKMRPGSVETEEQEKLIAEYQQKLMKEENWKPKTKIANLVDSG